MYSARLSVPSGDFEGSWVRSVREPDRNGKVSKSKYHVFRESRVGQRYRSDSVIEWAETACGDAFEKWEKAAPAKNKFGHYITRNVCTTCWSVLDRMTRSVVVEASEVVSS